MINAVWGLLDLAAMRRCMKVRRNDAIAALVAAGGVLVAGPMLGLVIAIGQSLLGMVYRSSRVDMEVLGKIPGEKAAWGGVRQHPERTTVPGILVLRVNVSLFWVNAAEVQEAILQAVDAAPDTKALILNLESTDQLETTSADMLSELRDQLAERNVDLYLVRLRWRVRTVLARSGLRARLGEDHLWHNVSQGIREARRQHGIERPGEPEPEPVVEEAEEEIIATPTFETNRGAKRLAAYPEIVGLAGIYSRSLDAKAQTIAKLSASTQKRRERSLGALLGGGEGEGPRRGAGGGEGAEGPGGAGGRWVSARMGGEEGSSPSEARILTHLPPADRMGRSVRMRSGCVRTD